MTKGRHTGLPLHFFTPRIPGPDRSPGYFGNELHLYKAGISILYIIIVWRQGGPWPLFLVIYISIIDPAAGFNQGTVKIWNCKRYLFCFPISGNLKNILFKNKEAPFVMELPVYRNPGIKLIVRHMWTKGAHYLKKMGGDGGHYM